MGYNVADRVVGKRLELRTEDGQQIVVDRISEKLLVLPKGDIRARYRHGCVYVLLDGKILQMTVPVAAKVGFALAKNGGACMYLGDAVLLEINREKFTLPPGVALQLGGVILKKADRADDWQRETH